MEDKTKNNSYKKMVPRSMAILLPPLFITVFLFATRFNDVFFIQEQHDDTIQAKKNMISEGRCSNMTNNTICCDRSNYHSDVCFMEGDIRTHPFSSSILLLSSNPNSSSSSSSLVEKIRPYTRKWESTLMNKIPELKLKIVDPKALNPQQCDVKHNATALFFSLGGYTGNIFHAFNNGLLPLYITSQHLDRQVVFVVLEYKHWWYTKYQQILSQLSDYPVIDFNNDTRTHCFTKSIIGLRFHDTLMVNPSRMTNNKTIVDFHNMLDNAYNHGNTNIKGSHKPKLVIMARKGTRAIENEGEVVGLAKEVGFEVEVLKPHNTMRMSTIYKSVSSSDVLMGVHGAALTHFLFMRPGTLFIQIVPIGVDELAQLCFGKAAVKLGIRYEDYKILANESSLYRKHGESDPIVRDPASVKARGGWEVTKQVYLEGQNVTLDISRLRERLKHAFQYTILQRRDQM